MYRAVDTTANASTNSANEDSTMNQAMQTFNFEDRAQVRVVYYDGKPWFVLSDLLKAFNSKTRPADAKASLDSGMGTGNYMDATIETHIGLRTLTIIREGAGYFLVSRSNTETGRKLNAWLFSYVLPALHKDGVYINGEEHMSDASEKNEALKAKVEELERGREHDKALLNNQESIIDKNLRHTTAISFVSLYGRYVYKETREKLGYEATKLSKQRGYRICNSPRQMVNGAGKPYYVSPNVYHHDMLHEAAVNLGIISPDESIFNT